MSYNQNPTTPTMRGLVNSGADLLKNMYDVKIYFPSANGTPDDEEFKSYPLTVRAAGFKIPDIETATYDIAYHGMKIKRPKTEITLDREVTITFREDAAFDLRRRLSAWHMATSDPVTGGMSNATQFFGKIQVATIAGAYFASTLVVPDGTGDSTKSGQPGIFRSDGYLTNQEKEFNPLAIWNFYNVWVSKVAGIEFSTETADANTFDVTFQYMDMDMPQYGGNTLDLGNADGWSK